jgi:periplasmic copper chaperone A
MSGRHAWSMLIVLACAVIGCDRTPHIEVSDAWSGALPPTATVGAAYMKITSNRSDELLSADTPIADHVQFHTTRNANGMMQMRELEQLPIERQVTLAFAPGANHIMLLGLRHPLVVGATFPMTLHFKNAGDVAVNVQVRNGLGE